MKGESEENNESGSLWGVRGGGGLIPELGDGALLGSELGGQLGDPLLAAGVGVFQLVELGAGLVSQSSDN